MRKQVTQQPTDYTDINPITDFQQLTLIYTGKNPLHLFYLLIARKQIISRENGH